MAVDYLEVSKCSLNRPRLCNDRMQHTIPSRMRSSVCVRSVSPNCHRCPSSKVRTLMISLKTYYIDKIILVRVTESRDYILYLVYIIFRIFTLNYKNINKFKTFLKKKKKEKISSCRFTA